MNPTDLEKCIAGIWAEILERDEVGLHEPLYTLGGDSLAALQIAGRIEDEFDIQLDLASVFDEPTVAGVAAVVARMQAHAAVRIRPAAVQTDDLLARIDDMSDDEVAAALKAHGDAES